MPIASYYFTQVSSDETPQPLLWVRIVNPDNGRKTEPLLALVDTGSDICLFPSSVAEDLGHVLRSVDPVEITATVGKGSAFPHMATIEILQKDVNTDEPIDHVLHTIEKKLIHFVKDGSSFLLGVEDFLGEFVLKVNYPFRMFSITRP